MPEALLIAVCGLLGLLVGSFLNVVIWRVPRGESIVSPPSHCPACGHAIRPRDNIPVVSWVLLRGRCRDCGTRISARYPLVEAATGVAFAVTAGLVGPSIVVIPLLWFVGTCIALALIDIDVKRLPNSIVLPGIVVVAAGLGVAAVVLGEPRALVRAVLCALALGGVYLLLALLYPAGMGMGDVKLAVLLGLVLGWFGVPQTVVGFFAGFLLGSVWGLLLIATGKGGRKTAVPFGPFMILGAWAGLLWGTTLAQWYGDLLPTG